LISEFQRKILHVYEVARVKNATTSCKLTKVKRCHWGKSDKSTLHVAMSDYKHLTIEDIRVLTMLLCLSFSSHNFEEIF
jgi:hypothetical protein